MAQMPGALENKEEVEKYGQFAEKNFELIGFNYGDIQIRQTNVPGLEKYNGKFLPDIAKEMGLTPLWATMKLASGPATVLQYSYISQEATDRLSQHPKSLYMTDSWMDPEGVQNPASFGNFPKFLQRAREHKLLSLEKVVHKMTGFAAERFGLEKRGHLKEGYHADILVFDWEHIRDNVTRQNTSAGPEGIMHVFTNGKCVVLNGEYQGCLDAGQTIRVN
jgi:N-acyl-D-aspartate/D-glutamate deacylase